MAKQATKAEKNPRSALVAMSLVDINLGFEPEFESQDEEVQLVYSVSITTPSEVSEDTFSFGVTAGVQKFQDDTDRATFVETSYFCAMKCLDYAQADDLVNAAKMFAGSVVWGNFCSLFALVSQQMHAEFPVLPSMAHRIEVVDEDTD